MSYFLNFKNYTSLSTILNASRLILLLLCLTFVISSCNPSKKSTKTSYSKPSTSSVPKASSEVRLRQDIVNFGKTCVGSKYKYAGKDRNGFDCSGFTSYVLKNYKVPASSSSKAQALQGRKIPVSQAKPGDLIFFGSAGKVSHVALVVSNTGDGITVVHSTSSKGVIVQNISQSSYWKPKILFARDLL